MIRCVAFDFDGTLVDSNRIKHDSFYEASAGFPDAAGMLDAILGGATGATRHEIMAMLARHLEPSSSEDLVRDLVNRYESITTVRVIECGEIPGAGAALAALHGAGLPLYVISATPQAPLRRIVEQRGQSHLFESILGAPTRKTDHLRNICFERGLAPDEIGFVGDSDQDQSAAEEFGCPFIGVGFDGSRFRNRPRTMINDLADLPAALGHLDSSA